MFETTPRPSRRPIRPWLQPLIGVLGALLFFWRSRSGWAELLLCAVSGLLLVAVFAPTFYEPFDRRLQRLQVLLTLAVSWVLLGLVFALIFIPGRLCFGLPRRSAVLRHGSLDTFWRDSRKTSDAKSFRQQY
jgi:hypothetical protein